MAQGYVIHVGLHAPEKVIVAQADKDGKPKGDSFETYKSVGSYLLMNRARVWCRRVGTDGKLPKNKDTQAEEVLEVNDTRYRGNLEFLKWQDLKLGAQAIEIRYLSISQSLDFDYQRSIQKIEVSVEQDWEQIELKPGENKFDPDKEALKIQLLKVHPQNRDSVSKNPNPIIKGYTYYEVSDEQVDKTFVRNKEASLVAGRFVAELSTHPQRLKNLLEIFKGYDADIELLNGVNHLSNDTDVYTALLKFADIPGTFGQLINRYKQDLQEKFELAKSYKALDLTKNGFIAMVVDNKKDIVWENADGKGDGMIEWVMENFLKEDVYERTQHFKALCSTLK